MVTFLIYRTPLFLTCAQILLSDETRLPQSTVHTRHPIRRCVLSLGSDVLTGHGKE